MLIILVAVAFISSIVIMANLFQAHRFTNKVVMNGLLLMIASPIMIVGALIFLSTLPNETDTGLVSAIMIAPEVGISFLIVSIILGIFSIAFIFSKSLRQSVQKYIVISDGQDRRYHADSVVHTLAVILMIFASMNTVGNFILAGGIEGLAEELTDIGITDLLTNFAIYVVISLFGVGIFVRRNIPRTIKRLGIKFPEKNNIVGWLGKGAKHLLIGAVVGFGMFWVQVALSATWQSFVSPETLAEQSAAAEAMFAAFSGSLWLGFLLAFTAGVGEELLFRGALQPIFGNVIVSIFFVMLHSQYILTPASLIIFTVSLVFGFLRNHYTTPSAMMAHFVYNFTPFVLISILAQWGITL